jgi:hypothetical protein
MATDNVDVFKTDLLAGASIMRVDTIRFRGEWWLVPLWLESPAEGFTMPARIIALAPMDPEQVMVNGRPEFLVSFSLPNALFDDPIPPEIRAEYRVVEAPDIRFPYLPGQSHTRT